ncbi:MAG TPA: hypothetical protein VKH15_18500 [Candidatus Acidoferrum sp.]|nr:hypothetical protein [Candidatus Acidoferrum sp.]
MKTKLRNITITLEEEVARWARIEAATRDTSVSRLLADILKERMMQSESNGAAEDRSQDGLKSETRFLSAEEIRDLSPESAAKLAAIRAITARIAALDKGPFVDHAEMLYDEHGLPK